MEMNESSRRATRAKGGKRLIARHHSQAEHVLVVDERPIQIGDLQPHCA
jgi:hypothetical protein